MTRLPFPTPRWTVLLGMAGSLLSAQSPIGIIISEQSRTSFTVQGAGARAMGLGGAFIAVADDATAVSFNPSGLAQLLKPEVSLVLRGVKRDVAYEDVQARAGARQLMVSDSLISNAHVDPLFLAGTVPLRVGERTLALQLSLQRLIALGESDTRDLSETPQGSAGTAPSRLFQSIDQKGQIDLYSLAMAYEASERILLGVSINLWRGAWDLDSRSTKTSAGTTTYVDFSQSNHLEGSNFNLGLIWRWPTWSLGLVHRTAFHADYTFGTYLDTSSLGGKPQVAPSIDSGLHWPSTTGLGFAYRPWERWLISTDVARTAWSTARYLSSRPSLNGLNFFDLDKGTRTPDSTDFHLGVEHILLSSSGNVVPLRLGYSREPQPAVDRVTGQQRVIYGASLGSGLKRGSYTVDVAYRFGWGKRQASQFLDVDQILSRTPPTSLGTEHLKEHRLDLSFNVQFARQPVERVLHHLFVGD